MQRNGPGRALPSGLDLAPVVRGERRVLCCHKAVYSGKHLPNTLGAVREAVEACVPRLEIDARFLADDGILVLHDEHLGGETTGSGPAASLTTAAARALRYRADERQPVALLQEVVAAAEGTSTLVQVDLKGLGPLPPVRTEVLAAALAPIRKHVIIGSQAHWNLWGLHERGFTVALDPTLSWHFAPSRKGEGLLPARAGNHGLWDDHPLAHLPGVEARAYLSSRVQDLRALLPAAEWMVDYGTLLHMASLGFDLGHELAPHGIALAAWTVKDRGRPETTELLDQVFAVGATTVITENAVALAGYLAPEPAELARA